MADTEVENVLREIRERVRAEAAERAPLVSSADAADGESSSHAGMDSAPGALARMETNLATTERTWNRLPPLLSNRAGWTARLELWVKRKIKRALHWFTWEQVNFNSAVHHALRDAVAAFADYERRLNEHDRRHAEALAEALAEARAEVLAAASALHAKFEATGAELASLRRSHGELQSLLEARDADARARLAEIESRLAATGARLDAEAARLDAEAVRLDTEAARFHEALAAAITQLRAEEGSLAGSLVQLRDEQRAHAAEAAAAREEQLAGLRRELDERAGLLREELRVSFRQLSLEAGEAAVAHDRARRHIESRLDALENR